MGLKLATSRTQSECRIDWANLTILFYFIIHAFHMFIKIAYCQQLLYHWKCDVARNFKGGIGSLVDPCVKAMGRRPCWPSRMEESYCTFGFGAIIWRDLRTLSLPRDSQCNNLYSSLFTTKVWFLKMKLMSLICDSMWDLHFQEKNCRNYFSFA